MKVEDMKLEDMKVEKHSGDKLQVGIEQNTRELLPSKGYQKINKIQRMLVDANSNFIDWLIIAC